MKISNFIKLITFFASGYGAISLVYILGKSTASSESHLDTFFIMIMVMNILPYGLTIIGSYISTSKLNIYNWAIITFIIAILGPYWLSSAFNSADAQSGLATLFLPPILLTIIGMSYLLLLAFEYLFIFLLKIIKKTIKAIK